MANSKKKECLKHALIERLMHYYHCLHSPKLKNDSKWITSSQIASYFNMDDTQVRKDLAEIGVEGRPRQGYLQEQIITSIRKALGLNKVYKGAIVGVGRLGGALFEYKDFSNYGLSIVALFDNNPDKIGKEIRGCKVFPSTDLETICREYQIQLGILTCPADIAQEAADKLIQAGIKAIWNFAVTNITVPEGIFVRNEHISVGLAEMAYHMNGF